MFDLGPHASFILWSYGITSMVVFALIYWVVADERKQNQLLQALEDQGVKRRSDRSLDDNTQQ